MPRNAGRRSAPKRKTKWCGSIANFNVPNVANSVTTDAVPLCLTTTVVVDQADPTVGWCRGNITLSRVTATDTAIAVMWAIVVQRKPIGSALPVQVFDPFNEDDLERQDILSMGALEIPPVVLVPSTDAAAIGHGSSVAEVNVRVGRKLARNTNNLFLWVTSSGLDNGMTVRTSIRTLMKF